LRALAITVLERGWLSANQVVFDGDATCPAAVVDTGFSTHAEQTVALIEHALNGKAPARIVNTHLHSDHCGGNHALQQRWNVRTWVPLPSLDVVRRWDQERLSYALTDQPCPRFLADHALVPGESIQLGPADWEIHGAPGHDMDAVMLFEPQTRTLISGDALWEDRLAIIFPELMGGDGFGPTRATLDLIERLAPSIVIPGHGRPFEDVARALAASRDRVAAFERSPEKHALHAARALLMFHMLEVRTVVTEQLVAWMLNTPIYQLTAQHAGLDDVRAEAWARSQIQRLIDDGLLQERGGTLRIGESMT